MNMGVLATRNKIVVMQYGINHNIGNHEILANSEFLAEDVYTHILDVQFYRGTNTSGNQLQYAILMPKYVMVRAINGSGMAGVRYNCQLPARSLTDAHYQLTNVSVLLRGICYTSFHPE